MKFNIGSDGIKELDRFESEVKVFSDQNLMNALKLMDDMKEIDLHARIQELLALIVDIEPLIVTIDKTYRDPLAFQNCTPPTSPFFIFSLTL